MSSSQQVTLAKACNGCIKAKRKCSRALPRCQRCAERNISCSYKNEPLSTPQPAAFSTDQLQHGGDYAQVDQTRGGNFHELGLSPITKHTTRLIFSVSSSVPSEDMQLRAPDVMLALDDSTVTYLKDRIRSLPATFARTGGTLFIHPRLYQDGLPPLLRKVFGLCSMLTQSGDGDQDIVSRAISDTSRTLIQSISSTDSFASKLAFVQSLILLQITTLFFPVTQVLRDQAEKRMPPLKNWIRKLYDSAPPHLSYSMSPYQAWILAESCRRTIHVAHMVLGLHTLLTQGCLILTPFVQALPLERNGDLWEDESMMPIQQGLILDAKEKAENLQDSNLISFRELKDLWEEGQIKHPGLFEEMLLVVCKGVDNVRLEST